MNSERKTNYTNAAQQRIVKVIFLLFSDVIAGLSPAAISKATGAPASTVTRDMDNLCTAGVAERDEITGNWRLTPRLPQQGLKAMANIDRAVKRIAETRQRYTRDPD